jgi:hypothetical protein
MGRSGSRAAAVMQEQVLTPERAECARCGQRLWIAYHEHRRVVRLDGVWRLTLRVRRCRNRDCTAYHQPYIPEEAGAWALPQAEFGLDVIALVGHLRSREQRRVPQIHRLHRYEELVALRLGDATRLRERLAEQDGVILALDGLQPDVGHEVLWVLRDVRSGAVLLARSLLGAPEGDLVPLLEEVRNALAVDEGTGRAIPILGVISDGQHAIREARATALRMACCTSAVSSTTCVRRRGRSSRATATRRRSSRSGYGACAPLNGSGSWTGGPMPRRRRSAATA